VEAPKVEAPKREECQKEMDEDSQVSTAYELEQLFEQDFFKMLKFVKRYPTLTKDELIEKYLYSERRY